MILNGFFYEKKSKFYKVKIYMLKIKKNKKFCWQISALGLGFKKRVVSTKFS